MTNDGEPGAGHPYDLPGVPWVSFFTGTGDFFMAHTGTMTMAGRAVTAA